MSHKKEQVVYSTRGVVMGNMWGGGTGAYPAKRLTGKSVKELTKQATNGLDGSLDRGMGFESLKGALLHVTKTTTVLINDKEFVNEEAEGYITIGELSDNEIEWLHQVEY